MKILHTADWHLGQTFFIYDRKEEHLLFLDWLKNQLKDIDLLLICGDIYDNPNPSAQSQKIFYSFLKEISTTYPHLQTIVIAGNHDSGARLEAPNPLLEEMNVTIRGVIKKNDDGSINYNNLIIPINKGGYCLAVPYLRQGDYPLAETYAEGVKSMYTALIDHLKNNYNILPDTPLIALGHLQATGSEISDSERADKNIVGGLECINPLVFSNVTYTALGHLHKAQRVSKNENIRYSGSPLPMSFAEKNNKQGVFKITTASNKEDNLLIEKVEFDSHVKLISVVSKNGGKEEIFNMLAQLPDGKITHSSPFVEVKIKINQPEPSLKNETEKVLEGKAVRLTRIQMIIDEQENNETPITYEELQKINPLEMAQDIYKRKFKGNEMPDNLIEMINSVIKEVE